MPNEGKTFVKPGWVQTIANYDKVKHETIQRNNKIMDSKGLKPLSFSVFGSIQSTTEEKMNLDCVNDDDDKDYYQPENEEGLSSSSDDDEFYGSQSKKAEMEKVRDEAKQSGIEMTAEELSTKVLKQGKNRSYIRGLGVGPTRTSLAFKSQLESRAHSELLSIRSEMDLLREQQQREREVYQLEREKLLKERDEQQKQHEREREEERVGREAQQKQLDRLESLLSKFMNIHGTP